ncbi:MAG: 4-hydroxy-tetrahydrodipicolinate reductase [Marinilabiliales bacterium]|nr:MAG: 4-hydroxy-tetrahydrodipicolinate reductase [Marinilabiliales bacterium]
MKILLIGYGKMGRLIEKEAVSSGHQIVKILDINDQWPEFSEKPDVAIEFTEPDSVVDNIKKCMQEGIPLVTGTTGWYDRLKEVKDFCSSADSSFLYASNFSIGVNLWFDLIRDAAKRFSTLTAYNPSLHEKHHEHKKDAPSGTAVTAAEAFLEQQERYDGWSLGKEDDKLYVEAVREGEVKGFHELRFQSSFDRVRISHEAFSRDGFVQGAVMAAEWLTKNKGIYDFHDVYDKVFNLNNISK